MLTFKEKTPDGVESPNWSGFAADSGKSVGYYLLDTGTGLDGEVTLEDIQAAITQILGTTSTEIGDGRLRRTMPTAHPMFPWQVAVNISKIWGVGRYTRTASAAELDVAPFPQFSLYEQYWFAVEFASKPYPVASDHIIGAKLPGSWYKDNGDSQDFFYCFEWLRFTDVTRLPANSSDSNLTQTGGQLGTMAFVAAGAPNGKTFPGTQQMQLPNQMIKCMWYGIPYRYVTSTNSYFSRWLNRVNQNLWTGLDFSAFPGELLYLGYTPSKYTPPVQARDMVFPGVFSAEKLCNVELNFLYSSREDSGSASTPSNHNYVVGGHNLLPWFEDRRYYWAKTITGAPSYLSAPFEIMFSDPDAEGGIAP